MNYIDIKSSIVLTEFSSNCYNCSLRKEFSILRLVENVTPKCDSGSGAVVSMARVVLMLNGSIV